MAIFVEKNTGVKEPDKVNIYGDKYRHSLVDSNFKPNYSLYSTVKGTPITGTYYRLFLGADEEPMGFQYNNVATYQSYTKIDNMIVKRDGNGSFQFIAETGEATETWVAFLFFDLSPIMGDLFVMDIGDGRAGLYQIAGAPEIKTFAALKVYMAEFKLITMMTQEIEDNLESKVVEHLVYSADSILNGGNAVITTEDYDNNLRLNKCAYFLTQSLLEKFYWEAELTMALKDEEYGWVYDPGYVDFFKSVIPTDLYGGHTRVDVIGYQSGITRGNQKRLTVWDLLKEGNFDLAPLINKEYFYYPKSNFFNSRSYVGFIGTAFNYIILPGSIEPSTIKGQDVVRDTGYGYAPIVPNPTKLNYYFSDGFYNKEGADDWERFVIEFFAHRKIDRKQLLDFYGKFFEWEEKDQFYRGPILVSMMLASKRVTGGW